MTDTPTSRPAVVPAGVLWPFILLTSLFAWWGLFNNMTDTLLAAFKKIMSMTDSQTALIQVVCYALGYGLMAVPAAVFVKRFSYKTGVMVGLALTGSGALLFYPAMLSMQYAAFLGAIWVLFVGLTFLEAAANPYILALGPEETATQRLNLAQSFNPAGSILGVFLSATFILTGLNTAGAEERAAMTADELQSINGAELEAIMGPYVAVGLIMLATLGVISATAMPAGSDAADENLLGSFGRLITNRRYRWGVLAQFFYVGAQIGVWSYTIRYVIAELNLESAALAEGETPESVAGRYYLAGSILFLCSRFVCTALMRLLSPSRLLAILAVAATAFTGIAILSGGPLGVYALIAVSGCMSLMFPTIFGLSSRGLGDDTKLAGAGHVMAISGGAFFTQLQGVISDATGSIGTSFWIPFGAFLFIAFYAAFLSERDGAPPQKGP